MIQYLVLKFVSNLGMPALEERGSSENAGFSLPNTIPITTNVGEPFQARKSADIMGEPFQARKSADIVGEPFQARKSRVETRSHRENSQKPAPAIIDITSNVYIIIDRVVSSVGRAPDF